MNAGRNIHRLLLKEIFINHHYLKIVGEVTANNHREFSGKLYEETNYFKSSDEHMKSREEYLIEFEAKLLGILKDQYKSINYNLATTYGLSMLVALFQWGSVSDISFFGAKLALNRTDMLILMPILLSIIYILINYQLLGVAEVYRQIHANANELLSINKDAKPITMKEIHLFGSGVTGLILSLSRWHAKRFLAESPSKFRLMTLPLPSKDDSPIKWALFVIKWIRGTLTLSQWIRDVVIWLITGTARFLSTIFLFLLPISVAGYYEYMEFFYHKPITFGLPLLSLVVLILITIFTIVCGFVLFATYLVDLIESIRKIPLEKIRNILEVIQKIIPSIYTISF